MHADTISMRKREDIILDILTTIIVGGSLVCLLGLTFWPGIFIIPSVILVSIFLGIVIADD